MRSVKRINDCSRIVKCKKALLTFNIFMFIPRLLFLVVVMFSVVVLVRMGANLQIDPYDFEAEVIASNLHQALAYEDPITGNPYIYLIDINKFDSEDALMHAVFIDDNRIYAAKIVLKDEDGGEVRDMLYNSQWYSRWKKISLANMGGFGVNSYQRNLPVLYVHNNIRYIGRLEIEVLIPKR